VQIFSASLRLLPAIGVAEAGVEAAGLQPSGIIASVFVGPVEKPTLPNSDSDLRCMVNLSGYALSYPPQQWATTPLVTDFAVIRESTPDPQAVFAKVLDVLKRNHADAAVGTYISGGQVKPVIQSYPPEVIHANQVPVNWLRPNTNRVDLANAEAAEGFAGLIVAECRKREGRFVFLDNIVHPSALPGWFPWETTCRFLSRVRRDLHENEKLLIANIAVAPWAMSDEDVRLLAESVDGMAFEMPFHKYARDNRERTKRQIDVYRLWLSQKKIVVLIPVDDSLETPAEIEREVRMLAGFAALVRNRGDSLFVAWPFWKPTPDWADWPKRLGESAGEWEFESDGVLSRRFQGSVLRVDVRQKEVRLTAPR
jgi:hypothetical protein